MNTSLPSINRVLITGGAGFIGKRLWKCLEKSGCTVALLDDFSVARKDDRELSGAHVIAADLRSEDAVSNALSGFQPDSVIHLAAVHHIPTCERKRAFSLDVNVVGTEVVLAAMERAEIRRLVLASSGAVYDWFDGPLLEDETTLAARDNYAVAKLANETQARFWMERTGGFVRIARIFNTIGPDDPNGHLIPDIIGQLQNSDHALQLGNITPKRDYIHVDDTAGGLAAVLADPRSGIPWDVFNICSGRETSVAELATMVMSAVGVNKPIEVDELASGESTVRGNWDRTKS